MGFCHLSEVSSFLSFAKLYSSASCSAHGGPSKPQAPPAEWKHKHCPEPHSVAPKLADAAMLHDCTLQTGFPFSSLLQRIRRPRGPKLSSKMTFQNGYLGPPNALLLGGAFHFLHTPCSSKTRLLTLKNEAHVFIQSAFWRMKLKPWSAVVCLPCSIMPTDYWALWPPCPSCFVARAIPVLAGELRVEF